MSLGPVQGLPPLHQGSTVQPSPRLRPSPNLSPPPAKALMPTLLSPWHPQQHDAAPKGSTDTAQCPGHSRAATLPHNTEEQEASSRQCCRGASCTVTMPALQGTRCNTIRDHPSVLVHLSLSPASNRPHSCSLLQCSKHCSHHSSLIEVSMGKAAPTTLAGSICLSWRPAQLLA